MRNSFKTALIMASMVCVFCFGFFFAGCGCDPKCKVTFDTKGGTIVKNDGSAYNPAYNLNQEVTQGKSFKDDNVAWPENVALEGYEFKGWYDKETGGEQYRDATPINADTKLYARWMKLSPIQPVTLYVITFKVGDTVYETIESKSDSSSIEKPADPTPAAGQTFVGWFVGDKEFDFNSTPTADVEVTAKFVSASERTYTITYDLNKNYIMGLDTALTSETADALLDKVLPEQYAQDERYTEKRKADWKFTAPNEPELTGSGYFFAEWYTDPACTDATKLTATSTFNDDTIVYAKWVKGIPEATDPEVDPYFIFEPGTHNTVLKGLTEVGMQQNYLEIPNTVVTISASFGSGTTKQNLVQLVIPSSVETICRDAFTNMYALWIVNIADNQVIKDENDAAVNLKDKATAEKYFANGKNVDRMYIGPKDDTKAKMETSAGIVHYKNTEVKVKGKGLDYAVTVAQDTKATNPTEFDLTNATFTHITGYCFYGCNNLQSVTLPRCLEQIYYRAFYNCKKLSSVTFVGADKNMSDLRIIGKAAFRNCTQLRSIVIPSGVQQILWHAFLDSGLTSATFKFQENWFAKVSGSSPDVLDANIGNATKAANYLTKDGQNGYVESSKIYCYVIGDLSGSDTIIDQNDLDFVTDAAQGYKPNMTPSQKKRCDLNGDGNVDAMDVKVLEIVINKNFVIPVPAITLSVNGNTGGKLNVNGDDNFNDEDYTALNTMWNGGRISSLTDAQKEACDINGDGVFSAVDLNLLAYMLGQSAA